MLRRRSGKALRTGHYFPRDAAARLREKSLGFPGISAVRNPAKLSWITRICRAMRDRSACLGLPPDGMRQSATGPFFLCHSPILPRRSLCRCRSWTCRAESLGGILMLAENLRFIENVLAPPREEGMTIEASGGRQARGGRDARRDAGGEGRAGPRSPERTPRRVRPFFPGVPGRMAGRHIARRRNDMCENSTPCAGCTGNATGAGRDRPSRRPEAR